MTMSLLRKALAAGGMFVLVAASTTTGAQAPKMTMEADGTLHVPALDVPLSSYMSPEAKQRFIELAQNPYIHSPRASKLSASEAVDDWYRTKADHARKVFAVDVGEDTLGGVRVDVITPKAGVAAGNRSRVLINLHGGGFRNGSRTASVAESIPVAAVARIKVVSVDYRMAPAYRLPAASEDVAAVYKALLREYKPRNIGIYGCSAGGMLTSQTVAWLQKERLPRPGAIGIFCAGAGASESARGDSRRFEGMLDASWQIGALMYFTPAVSDYFPTEAVNDPLVSPVESPATLAKFPPTLLISGTRDMALSNVVHTHAQLVKAGVEADLHIWDGMGHNFLLEMDLPESKEAYDVIAAFFRKHLGQAAR
ncbi:MAG: alpha/beta hydrolase [Gammaproteobacteria bacterium]